MAAFSDIAWCHHTLNGWWGCEKIQPECLNCYAEEQDDRFPVNGERHWGKDAPRRFFGDAHWNAPLQWARFARELNERHRVFCASMSDVFEDRRDLDVHRARLWELIKATPELDWLLVTKRVGVARRLLPWVGPNPMPWPNAWLGTTEAERSFKPWTGSDCTPWPNVWLGTSAGTAETLQENGSQLLMTPAALRFLSMEPLLEDVEIPNDWLAPFHERDASLRPTPKIDWVIVGGESDNGGRVKNPRTMGLRWARRILEQCDRAGTPFFMKQTGSRLDRIDSAVLGQPKHKKGGDPNEWPEDLRVQQFPKVAA